MCLAFRQDKLVSRNCVLLGHSGIERISRIFYMTLKEQGDAEMCLCI